MNFVLALTLSVSSLIGYLFPHISLALLPYTIFILFLLLFFSGLTLERHSSLKLSLSTIFEANIIHYLILPSAVILASKLLIDNHKLINGLTILSLCPLAVVAPFYTRLHNGDENYSVNSLVSTIIIFPILVPALFSFFSGSHYPFSYVELLKNTVFLTVLPFAIGYIAKLLLGKISISSITQKSINVGMLSLIMLIMVGSSKTYLNSHTLSPLDIVYTILVILFLDFGSYFIFKKVFDKGKAINLSMKNFAIGAGLILMFDPASSLPVLISFITRPLFFSFLLTKGKK